MSVTKTDITPERVGQERGGLQYRSVKVDNTGSETTSAVDFASYGLGVVLSAVGYNRTGGAQIAVTISAKTTVTTASHTAGDDCTIIAIGLAKDVTA